MSYYFVKIKKAKVSSTMERYAIFWKTVIKQNFIVWSLYMCIHAQFNPVSPEKSRYEGNRRYSPHMFLGPKMQK